MLYTLCWGDAQRRVGFSLVDGRWLPRFSRVEAQFFEEETEAVNCAGTEGALLMYTEEREGEKKVAKLVWAYGVFTEGGKQKLEADLTYIINSDVELPTVKYLVNRTIKEKHTMLNQAMKDELFLAIESAKYPGGCRYVVRGEPACVVGQLAYIKGVDLDVLSKLDRPQSSNGMNIRNIFKKRYAHKEAGIVAEALTEYPMELLAKLQEKWDSAGQHINGVKDGMRKLVDEA